MAGAVMVLSLGSCSDDKRAGGSTDGATIYKAECARCHGAEGVPAPGMRSRNGVKPLTSEHVQAMSDEEIQQRIIRGSKNRMMPAFGGALKDEQLKAVVAHIRTLSAQAAPAAAP